MTERIGIMKDAFGTKPQVYYIGLDKDVADPLKGWESHYYHKEFEKL